MPTSKNLDSLVINKVESQEVYEWMKANNKTNEDELYLTPDASGGTTVDSELSATSTNPVQNKVIKSALDGKLSTSGGTLTGNLTGKYITGTWLQSTAAGHQEAAATKVAVLDAQGWIYYRTPAELMADMGLADGTEVSY